MKKIIAVVIIAAGLLIAGSSFAAGNLAVKRLLFADNVQGLGQFTPHAGTSFSIKDTCNVYIEVSGFETPLTLNTTDQYNVDMAVDVKLKQPGFRFPLQPNVAVYKAQPSTKIDAHFFSFSFGFNGWKPGQYTMEVGVRDNIGGQTVSQDIVFQITEPTPEELKQQEAKKQANAGDVEYKRYRRKKNY